MPLTREHLTLLSAPFKSEEHEFKPPRGYVYIAETAICERIESIDPSWEWHIQSTQRYDNKGAIATTIGHLTILGVTRGGDGQQAVEFVKGTDTESGEAEKGSETDALKRAARKFGIGRYLLDCPKDVKGYGQELDKWLKSLKQGAMNAPAPSASKPAQAPVSGAPEWYNPLLKSLGKNMDSDTFKAFAAEVKRLKDEGTLRLISGEQTVRIKIVANLPAFFHEDAVKAARDQDIPF